MKALLLPSVLLSGFLALTTAAVLLDRAVEAAPQDPQEENQVVEQAVGKIAPEERFFSCPSGWIRYKNSCYLYVNSGRSWSSAQAYCSSLGASLPSVQDVFDYTFLQELTSRAGNTVSWMGGFYFQGWRWVDQTPFNYNNWSSQNSVSRYQCIHVNSRAGWSNNNCANGWTFICMKRTDTC